jgi:hypothetical protein
MMPMTRVNPSVALGRASWLEGQLRKLPPRTLWGPDSEQAYRSHIEAVDALAARLQVLPVYPAQITVTDSGTTFRMAGICTHATSGLVEAAQRWIDRARREAERRAA